MLGNLAAPIPASALPRVEGASIDEGHVAGPLSELRELRSLVLGKMTVPSLAPLSGCARLTHVRLEMARGLRVTDFDLRTDEPPSALVELEVDGAGVASLEGLEEMAHLEYLIINNPRGNQILDNVVDLRPLAGCRRLRRVALYMNGDLVHADVLTGLPALEGVNLLRGRFSPDLPPAPWLDVSGRSPGPASRPAPA
ncbi:hypothetical protein [Cellulomonas cellasea]|uniref:Uncharacterized protein n=2 Tax=Cellulomonas cellasea TaxID=43670 RepID=A0A0A0B990_9CELL|nr:hypothetical protein [Cellulomonas cellasea]KGM02768.1 hypothetical protein Q760_11465 [Cellulomonas cellasea DSM 20118]GEA86686.1 hypothetical protein CCE01nite_06350 [Cellulomonas cellasea]